MSETDQIVEARMCSHWEDLILGNEEAFSEIYSHYFTSLFRYGYHFVPNSELVKDAIQELFVDIWRRKKNLSPTTSVKFYLYRSLRRRLAGKVQNESHYQPLNEELERNITSEENTEDMGHLSKEHIQNGIALLTLRQQEALRLRFYEDFDWPQLAEILRMNEQSARNLIQRAIVHLRKNLSEKKSQLH